MTIPRSPAMSKAATVCSRASLAAGEELLERLVEGLARGALGLRRVEHPEAGVDPDRDRVRGEQPVAEAVDRRHPGAAERRRAARAPAPSRAAARRSSSRADPLAQLGGGLVGEGEGEDRVGRDALVADEAAVAVDQDAGLAGAGAGLDQDVAAARPRSPRACSAVGASRSLTAPSSSSSSSARRAGARSRRQIGAKSQKAGQTPWPRRPGRGPGIAADLAARASGRRSRRPAGARRRAAPRTPRGRPGRCA